MKFKVGSGSSFESKNSLGEIDLKEELAAELDEVGTKGEEDLRKELEAKIGPVIRRVVELEEILRSLETEGDLDVAFGKLQQVESGLEEGLTQTQALEAFLREVKERGRYYPPEQEQAA